MESMALLQAADGLFGLSECHEQEEAKNKDVKKRIHRFALK